MILPYKKWSLAILSVIAIALVIGAFYPFMPFMEKKTPSMRPAETTTVLYLSPKEQTLNIGKSTQVSVIANTQKNEKLKAATAIINFDPKILTVNKITPGELIEQAIVLEEMIDNTTGVIKYTLASPPQNVTKKQMGIVAILEITAKEKGQAILMFEQESSIVESGKTRSLTPILENATIKVE